MSLWKLLLFGTLLALLIWSIPSPYCKSGELKPGVVYAKHSLSVPVSAEVYELLVDPQQASIMPVVAHNSCGATEATSSIARRVKAVAAVNGGMFGFGQSLWHPLVLKCAEAIGYNHHRALPLFALKKNGTWLSLSPQLHGCLAWSNGGKDVVAGNVKTVWQLRIGDTIFPIYDLNKPLLTVLFTPEFGATTPRRKDIVDVVVRDNKVIACVAGGCAAIPRDGYVYRDSAEHIAGIVKSGDQVQLKRLCESDNPDLIISLETMTEAIGGMPLLINHGVVTPFLTQETAPFFRERMARTAVGILKDGRWLLVVVGQSTTSSGMSLPELAEYMHKSGCVVALNLDGGSSSTMVVNNRVVNMPSGRKSVFVRRERVVANALVIVSRL